MSGLNRRVDRLEAELATKEPPTIKVVATAEEAAKITDDNAIMIVITGIPRCPNDDIAPGEA
jgi:hypothetical protein